MKFAPIVPYAYTHLLKDMEYHLAIAPLMLHNKEYYMHYNNTKGYSILDNGAPEGARVSFTTLHRLAEECKFDEIVIPDYLRSAEKTIRAARRFKDYRESEFTYAGVAQGENMAQLMKCIYYFAGEDWIDVLMLPRNMNKEHKMNRYILAEQLISDTELRGSFKAIHCLGMSDWVFEPILLGDLPLRGIDSSYPASAAIENIHVESAVYVERQKDFFNAPLSPKAEQLMEWNINLVKRWCREETSIS